jgi:hypothetical protein
VSGQGLHRRGALVGRFAPKFLPSRARRGESRSAVAWRAGRQSDRAVADHAAALFEPISLELLETQATLTTRKERKYVLEPAMFERLMSELHEDYLVLDIDGDRVFHYDTVYFDTPKLTTYRQHVQGRRRRFKCRTRLYAEQGPCFFEVKMKGGRGETIKRRLAIDVDEHGTLTPEARAFLDHMLHEEYGAQAPAALRPTLRTTYRRLTLVGRMGRERLTFDLELAFAARGGREYSIKPGRIFLETKFAVGSGQPDGRAAEVLQELNARPVGTCSKYCLGAALSHPELPDNPFRPLLRRHFDEPRSRVFGPGILPLPIERVAG